MSLHRHVTASPCHCIAMSKHRATEAMLFAVSLHRCVTASPCHCIAVSMHRRVTASPCYCITMSLHRRVKASLRHCSAVSQHCRVNALPCQCIAVSMHHHVKASLCHCSAVSRHRVTRQLKRCSLLCCRIVRLPQCSRSVQPMFIQWTSGVRPVYPYICMLLAWRNAFPVRCCSSCTPSTLHKMDRLPDDSLLLFALPNLSASFLARMLRVSQDCKRIASQRIRAVCPLPTTDHHESPSVAIPNDHSLMLWSRLHDCHNGCASY